MGLQISAKKRVGYKIASLIAIFAVVAQPMYGLVASRVANAVAATVNSQSELVAKIGDATVDTITLGSSFTISSQVDINRTLTLDGGGYTLSGAAGWNGTGSNDSILAVTGGNPTLSNLTVDGASTSNVQGIQVWQSSAKLSKITAKNNQKAGIHVNGSTVTATDITTSNNSRGKSILGIASFGGILVSSGTLTIEGQSHHTSENNQIRRDGGTVVDSNTQYGTSSVWGVFTRYTLKSAPVAPTITAPVSPVITSSADLAWTAPSTSGNKNAAESYLVSINGGVAVSVSGSTHSLTGLADGNYTATVQSVAKSGLLGGTATLNFTVAIPDTEKPEGSATYAGGYLNPTTNVRYVQKIEDLSFTAKITDNKDVAWATYRAINVNQPSVEACGNWNTGALTAHIFTAPLQTSNSYTVLGSNIKTCDPSMKWKTGSRYQFIHEASDSAGNKSQHFNSTNQLVEIDKNPPTLSNLKMLIDRGNGFVESSLVKSGDKVKLVVDATDGASGMRGVDLGISAVNGGGAIIGLETTNLNPKMTHQSGTDAYVYEFTMPATYINTHQPINENADGLQVKMRAIDNVGNYGKSSTDTNYLFHKFTFDNTAPAAPTNPAWKPQTGTLNGVWTNVIPGNATWEKSSSGDVSHYLYKYWNDIIGDAYYEVEKAWPTPDGNDIGNVNSYFGNLNRGDGMHHFSVAAVDHAGNVSAWANSASMGLDTVKPTISAILNDTISKDGGIEYNPESITVKASDDRSGLYVISYNIWEHDPSKGKGPYGTGHHQVTSNSNKSDSVVTYNASNLPDGKYFINYSAGDKANNSAGGKTEFIIDRTPPVIRMETTGENANSGTIGGYNSWKDARKVIGTITDNNHSETKLFRINNGGEDTEVKNRLDITDTDDPTVKRFEVNNGLAEGTYYIIHIDKAEQESEKEYFVISNKKPLIDNVKNIISENDSDVIAKDGDIFIGNNTPKVTFDVGNGDNANAVVDEVVVRGWIYDGNKDNKRGAAAFADAVITKDPATGNYEVDLKELLGTKSNWVGGRKVIVMLQAKNQANVHYQYIFTATVDTTAPILTISVDQTDGTKNTRTISGTTDDKMSPVVVKLGNKERTIQPEAFTDNEDGTFGWSAIFAGLGVANHQATVHSQDGLGNQSIEQAVSFEVEAEAVSTTPTVQDPVAQNSPPVATPLANIGLILANNPAVLADEDNTVNNAGANDSPRVSQNNGGVLDADDNRANADGQAGQKGWSLANLVMAIVAGIIGLVALFGLGKKEGRVARILAVAIAAGAVSAFLIKEDMSQPMGLVNLWTIAFVAVPIAQIALLSLRKDVVKK